MSGGKLNWPGWATWTLYGEDDGPPEVPPNIHLSANLAGNPIAAIRAAVIACSEAKGGEVVVGRDYPTTGDIGFLDDAFAMTYQREDEFSVPEFRESEAFRFLEARRSVLVDFRAATLRRGRLRRIAAAWGPMIHLKDRDNLTILHLNLGGSCFEALWVPPGEEDPVPDVAWEPFGTFETDTVAVQAFTAVMVSGCRNITLLGVHVREAVVASARRASRRGRRRRRRPQTPTSPSRRSPPRTPRSPRLNARNLVSRHLPDLRRRGALLR